MELSKEKVLQERREEIKKEIKANLAAMLYILGKEDPSNTQLSRFFAASQHASSLISG